MDEQEADKKSASAITDKDISLAESFRDHAVYAEQAKNSYIEIYQQMVAKISTAHLEPFAIILLEQNNYTLDNPEELVDKLRARLLENMNDGLEKFWKNFDVDNSLIALEMLKEKFKDCVGTEWNMNDKTPMERTLPSRMRYKKAQLENLQIQIKRQNEELEELRLLREKNTQRMLEVERRRVFFKEAIENSTKKMNELKPKMLELQEEFLDNGSE